jgi:hypothetical protein
LFSAFLPPTSNLQRRRLYASNLKRPKASPIPHFIIADLNDGMILPVVPGNGVLFTQNPAIENEIDL